jgi:hypothetical protein
MQQDFKISFYVNGNGDGEWSSDGVMLWLGRRQNGDAVEWWGE